MCDDDSTNGIPPGQFHLKRIVEIKGPESWWIAKSITISRVVNQSKVNPQRPKGVVN